MSSLLNTLKQLAVAAGIQGTLSVNDYFLVAGNVQVVVRLVFTRTDTHAPDLESSLFGLVT